MMDIHRKYTPRMKNSCKSVTYFISCLGTCWRAIHNLHNGDRMRREILSFAEQVPLRTIDLAKSGFILKKPIKAIYVECEPIIKAGRDNEG